MEDLQDGLAEYCRCEKCEPKFVDQVYTDADAMFEELDPNGDGSIGTKELRSHLLTLGYTEKAAYSIFRSLDEDDNGILTRDELRAGFLKYSMLREAIVAVVKTLVKNKRWSSSKRLL